METNLKSLKKDFLEDGTLRLFRVGANAKEYLYYEDTLSRIILREALSEDKNNILKVFSCLNSKDVEKALKYDPSKVEMVLIAETKTKFIAIIETKIVEERLFFKISFKNSIMQQIHEEKILNSFLQLAKKELLYEDVFRIIGDTAYEM